MNDVDKLLSELTGGDDERAEAAAQKLAEVGDPAVEALSGLLRSKDPDQRWWAVRALAGMERPRIDLLARALADESAEVRAAAALALGAHPSADVIPHLTGGLEDQDNLVSTLCVNGLVAAGSACVPSLLEAFPSAGKRARIQIMRTLAALKDPRAIKVMLDATEDDSAMLSYWAQEGLDALGLNMVYLMPH